MSGKLKRWSLARCQNVEYMRKLWQENDLRIEKLEDVDLAICKSGYLAALIQIGKQFDDVQKAFEFSPELKRDFKIALAKMEYEQNNK